MKYGVTRGETLYKRRRSSQVLSSYLGFAIGLLVINVALIILAMRTPSKGADPEGFALAGVVKIQTTSGSGSGFLVAEDLVLTAAHVVEAVGNGVTVIFETGAQVPGNVIASGYNELQNFVNADGTISEGATQHDWALVRLSTPQDPALILFLGDSGVMSIGEDEVWAVGYPGGADHNVSAGILSGRDANELRTDAPIDPGHSGGALVSVKQKAVVGILVSVPIIGGTGAQSVHNAVPIETAIDKCQQAGFPIE